MIFRPLHILRKINLFSTNQCKRYMDTIHTVGLIDTVGKTILGRTVLKNKKYIMYYFSASWCAPCKFLLPTIKQIYSETCKRKISFEVIYIPLDTDETEMMEYFKEHHGKWLAIPFGNPAIDELKLRFEVTHVPTIVVTKNDGTIITKNGKKEVEELGINVLVTWID